MKCNKCKKDVSRKDPSNVFIETHILCGQCFQKWQEFLDKYRTQLDKRRSQHNNWCNCWERIYAKFLKDYESVKVQFT